MLRKKSKNNCYRTSHLSHLQCTNWDVVVKAHRDDIEPGLPSSNFKRHGNSNEPRNQSWEVTITPPRKGQWCCPKKFKIFAVTLATSDLPEENLQIQKENACIDPNAWNSPQWTGFWRKDLQILAKRFMMLHPTCSFWLFHTQTCWARIHFCSGCNCRSEN